MKVYLIVCVVWLATIVLGVWTVAKILDDEDPHE